MRTQSARIVRGSFIWSLCIALAAAFAPALAARPDTGNDALTTAQAQEVAAKLGVPVMIIYMNYQTTDPLAKGYYRTLLNAAGANRQYVIAEVDYQQMDDLAAENKKKFPTWTFRTVPYYAFMSPEGEFYAGGNSYDIDEGNFDRDRKDILAKHPPFPLAMQKRAAMELDQAALLIDTRQYQRAQMLLDKTIGGMWFPRAMIERGKAMREFCDAQGRDLLTQATDAARAEKTSDAMFAYDLIIECCGSSSEQGRDAARSMRTLQIAHASEARDYTQQRPQKLAAWYLTQAQKLADADHIDAALQLCRSIRVRYARTDSVGPADELAKSLLEKIHQRELDGRSQQLAAVHDYLPLGMTPPPTPSSK